MDKLQQAQKDGVVLGLKDVAGVVPRLDIDKLLLEQPDTFNLFCLALNELMNDPDASKIMGYFQVAGIHGLPKTPWDGITVQTKLLESRSLSGYCAHSSPIFPTWHRPYLAMIEQTIYSKMVDIAARFPPANRQTYKDAAQKFRLPYIDYYRPRGKSNTPPNYDFSVPKIFVTNKILLRTTPKGDLELQENPLHLFKFPANGSLSEREWSIFASGFSKTETQRYPFSQSPVTDLNIALNGVREDNTNFIVDMISDPAYDSYMAMAMNVPVPGLRTSGSLEGIHGDYHLQFGGTGGHMSRVPTAAFDPIFWLHHCQIDRWFAVWQAAHPTRWFNNDQDELLPFRSPPNPSAPGQVFWSSRGSRTTEAFGYTYPDLTGGPQQVTATFKTHYSWAVRTLNHGRYGTPPADMQPLDVSKAQAFQLLPRSSALAAHPVAQALFSAPATVTQAFTVAKEVVMTAAPAVSTTATTDDSKAEAAPKPPTAEAKAVAAERVFTNMAPAEHAAAAAEKPDESKIRREWYVDNIVERLALNGAFTIFTFIGPTPAPAVSPSSYLVQPTLAGASHVFAAPREACDNCGMQDDEGVLVTNTAGITSKLLDCVSRGELADLSAEHVTTFLVKNLKWRIVTVNGDRVDPRTVAGLKLGVSSKLTQTVGGQVSYEEFPEVVRQIIENSS